MDVLRTVAELKAWRNHHAANGTDIDAGPADATHGGGAGAMSGRGRGGVVWVPTMGALHAGHLAHVGRGRAWLAEHATTPAVPGGQGPASKPDPHLPTEAATSTHAAEPPSPDPPPPSAGADAGRVIVSVFVNPTQFGPGEDLARYPRTLEVDLAKCEAAGASAVFAPEVETMYPPAVPGAVAMSVPGLTDVLEGERRPGHFAGVCRVVTKFLNLIRPDAVTFGQKDYQQLCVVRAVIEDLMMGVDILEVPTVREDDGLAMSSRNRYLDPETRRRGLALSKALRQAEAMVADGETDPGVLESAMTQTMRAHQVRVDYAAVRRAGSLARPDVVSPGACVALVAGRVGGEAGPDASPAVRLIDNTPL